jgi:hypothetical protein
MFFFQFLFKLFFSAHEAREYHLILGKSYHLVLVQVCQENIHLNTYNLSLSPKRHDDAI